MLDLDFYDLYKDRSGGNLTGEEFDRVKDAYVGGDIEMHGSDRICRGPIASIERDGEKIVVTPQWLAITRNLGRSYVHEPEAKPIALELHHAILNNAFGNLVFNHGFDPVILIRRDSGDSLDPNRVIYPKIHADA